VALSKLAKAVWDELPDDTKEQLLLSAWDVIRGKPPRTVRIAKLKAESMRARVEVRARFAK
jgi:hypothetical protein